MLNKKSMGLHWDILLISLFISIGILYYSIASMNIPKVGEISLETIKTLEKNNIIPSVIERVMKWTNKKTINALDENKIFELRDYCESAEYKRKISGSKQTLNGGFESLEGKNANCHITEDDLKEYFEIIFEAEYNDFRARDLDAINLDLSKTIYTSSIGKENEGYFNIINTSNGLEIPISTKKDRSDKQIGKITMSPAYKFPVDYNFDDENKEVCILSKDCGATCDDVVARYSEIRFEKKSYPCNEYFFCVPSFPDDFGANYPCASQYFCMEDGVNSLVCPDCYCLEDWHFIEDCDPYGVAQYRTQQRTCKHKDICPDSMKYREVYDCCGYSYKSCDCGSEPCCIQLDYCSCEGATQCGVCGNDPCQPPPTPPTPPPP